MIPLAEHIVVKGESLTSIAEQYGLRGDWKALWELQPEDFKKSHKPMLIFPKEIVLVPADGSSKFDGTPETTNAFILSDADNNLVEKARRIHKDYTALRDEHARWYYQSDAALRMSIAQTAKRWVTQDPKRFGSRVDHQALEDFIKRHTEEDKKRREKYELKAKELCDIMLLPRFSRQLVKFHPKVEEREEIVAECFSGLAESTVGATFLVRQLDAYGNVKKGTPVATVINIGIAVTKAFLAIITEMTAPFVAVARTDAVEGLLKLVTRRQSLEQLNIRRAGGNVHVSHQSSTSVHVTVEFDARVVKVLEFEKRGLVASLQNVAPRLTHFVNVLNFCVALKALHQALGETGGTDVDRKRASIMAAIGTVSPLMSLLESTKLSAQILRRRGWLRIAGQATEASVLGVIAGIFDCIVGAVDAVMLLNLGDYNAAVFAGIGAAGGFLCAVGAAFLLSAELSAVAPPLLIVAAILGAISAIGLVLTRDDDWQTWLRNCEFGDNKESERRGNLKLQLELLIKLYETATVDVERRAAETVIRVYPVALFSYSSCAITLSYSVVSGPGTAGHDVHKSTPLSQVERVVGNDEHIDQIVFRLPPMVGNWGGDSLLFTRYDLLLEVDVHGDGKWPYRFRWEGP